VSASSFRPLAVTATAAITSAGAGAAQTCASIRAGIVRLGEHAYHRSVARDPEWQEGEPLVVAAAGDVDPFAGGHQRLHALLAPALVELTRDGRLQRADLAATALLVALPSSDPATDRWALDDLFVPDLCRRTGLSFHTTRVSRAGHAGVFALLDEAAELLAGREVEACVVAGVDSYLSVDRLKALDAAYRLKSARNVDGFVPGEAAAAILVESPRRMQARKVEARATIAGLGLGEEPETVRSDKASTGRGLTAALRQALPSSGNPAWVLCDLNGESYRAFEWGVALARLGERLGGIERLGLPARSVGDVGAATGALLAIMAVEGFRRGYAPAGDALCWTGSEGPLRAAARVSRAPEGEAR
jgi:3-oxoacyl-[acyl-carrier-protein] synthase-1